MYKGVIFDLDGTVLDTIEDIKDALNEALGKMGYFHSYSNEETMLMVGSGFKVLIERAVPENTSDEDVEKVLHYFIEAYDKCYAKKTKAFSDIREVLGTMMDKGIKLAINSNKQDDFTKALIAKCFNDINWTAVIGYRNNHKKKPDPEAVFEIAKLMNLPLNELLYVGDSDVDIMTGHNAGIDTILVSWGYRPLEIAKKTKPKYIANNPEEMLEIIIK